MWAKLGMDSLSSADGLSAALQLVLHTEDSDQLERRLDRFLDVAQLDPSVHDWQQLQAFAPFWQHCYDSGIFSEE
eukprot:SAG31_NODE_31174_length_371_cov_0.761029_1_plen_74_part_10